MQPKKVRFPKLLIPFGMVIVLSLVQLVKACSPKEVTVSGIFMYCRLKQLLKTPFPMVVSPSGSSILLKLVH